jgi:hypothetical protein
MICIDNHLGYPDTQWWLSKWQIIAMALNILWRCRLRYKTLYVLPRLISVDIASNRIIGDGMDINNFS